MAMMMMNHRRCSGCCKTGHNSRTCPYYSSVSRNTVNTVKLFGVRLPMTVGSSGSGSAASLSCSVASPNHSCSPSSSDGYVSDNEPSTPAAKINRHHLPPPINKGIPWNEEEHRLFLLGLEKLGKGDWRGISRNFVQSRTPTQVASHAQKYFLRQQQRRQSNTSRRKRRSSLFDMFPNMGSNSPSLKEEQVLLGPSGNVESVPSIYLSLNSEFEAMEATSEENNVEEINETIMGSSRGTPAWSPLPGLFRPPYPSLPFSLWPSSSSAYSFGEDTLILEGRPLH